jgi:hypothetical protein
VVGKTGLLPDGQVTVSIWLDSDADGDFDPANDLQLTSPTAFTAGYASIFSVPIVTVTEANPWTVFVVADFDQAGDGLNVSFFIEEGDDVRGTGVPSGASSTTAGTFPVTSGEVVVGSQLQVEPATGAPDRIVQDSQSVRVLGLSVRGAGEDFAMGVVNITLLGTIPRSNVQTYVTIDSAVASATASFNAARLASIPLNHNLLESSGWVTMEVRVNLSGGNGFDLGLELTVGDDIFAVGAQTGIGRTGVSSAGFPMASGLVGVTVTGNLSVDLFIDPALETPFRAGLNDAYVMSLILHSHGEDIDFNKLEISKSGGMADGDFTALTLRVQGGPWFPATFFSGKVTWDAGVTGQLFPIDIGASNVGEAIIDIYANLSGETQGEDVTLKITGSSKMRGYGQTSLTTLYAGAEAEPYDFSSGERKVMGDVYVTGFNLAPAYVLAPVSLVPVLKLTLKAIGENITLEELFLISLQGVPPASSLTVHLYKDADNDTTTSVDGNDVEIAVGQAGPFGSDAVKAFTPALSLTAAVDMNIYFAIDFASAAGGFSLETRVDTSDMDLRGVWSGEDVPANSVIGGANPPVLATQTPAVPIYYPGSLTASSADINPQDHAHLGSKNSFLRLELTASAVESISISSITFRLLGNATPSEVRVHLWWDKNKNNETSVGEGDVDYGHIAFSTSDLVFALSPAVTVAAGATEHVIVMVEAEAGLGVGQTIGVEVSLPASLTATGNTSGWGMTPTGSFPRSSNVVPVVA